MATTLLGVIFGLSLAGAGGFFAWYLWQVHEKAAEQNHWRETPCLILQSRVDEEVRAPQSAMIFRPAITYRYAAGGRELTSETIRRVHPESTSREKMEALVERYPAGSSARCFVDPEDPGRAVLIRDSKAALYSIWFPLLFVVGGLGVIWTAVRRRWGASGAVRAPR